MAQDWRKAKKSAMRMSAEQDRARRYNNAKNAVRTINSASHSVANTGARASVKPLTNATRARYLNLASKKKQRNLTQLMP